MYHASCFKHPQPKFMDSSSIKSSSMQVSAILPPDIFEEIHAHVVSEEDAKALSLTCKSSLLPSRRRLLNTITLQGKRITSAFLTLLDESPHLKPYFKHLAFVDLENLPESTVLAILSNLKGQLSSLSILQSKFLGCNWGEISDEIKVSLTDIANEKGMRMDCQIFNANYASLELFPSIRHLDLYGPRLDCFDNSGAGTLCLESLRISFLGSLLANPSRRSPSSDLSGKDYFMKPTLFDLSKAKTLVIDTYPGIRLDRIPKEMRGPSSTGPWLAMTAHAASATLVEIYWEVGALDRAVPTISLCDFPSLQSLNIGFSRESQNSRCANRCCMILNFLRSRGLSPPIARSTFTFDIEDLLAPGELPGNPPGSPVGELAIGKFIDDFEGCSSVTIGFIHQPVDYAVSPSDEQRYEKLLAAARRRPDCQIEVLRPDVVFGTWCELRNYRPYGHNVIPPTHRY
ncbi:hypothetical protein DL96DRAFT_907279 [Flagelloscypha sp. PMI_526]|nr:hypothetical protein DL96DRAFT_907279 [Flagelloscypha sp. PMI_526]